MSYESSGMNIPNLSTGAVVDLLCRLYCGAVREGIPLKSLPTPFLWGAPGVGKSEGVDQLAGRMAESLGLKVNVSIVHLLLLSPVDMRGVPVADEHREYTVWLKPLIFKMDPSKDVINIIFLDELSASPQSMQAAAYQITLDRRIGEHVLPDNCIVIAAGNRTTDQSVAYKMPKALCNRLMHFAIRSDYESWKKWAIENDVDRRIIGFVGFNRSRLCTEPDSADLAYPTPRSWSFVNTVIKATGCGDSLIPCHEFISGCVGIDTAIEFERWCAVYRNLPSTDEIFAGTCRTYPKKQDELYALTSGLAAELIKRSASVRVTELENVCAYASRFPADYAMSFFSEINADETLSLKLLKCRAFAQWIAKTKTHF